MTQKFSKLYSINSNPDNAYFLSKGSVYFYPSSMDKYIIKGHNVIIGSTELMMNNILLQTTKRIETAIITNESIIKKIPVNDFLIVIKSFAFLINTSVVLAKQVLLTNEIFHKNINQLGKIGQEITNLYIQFYKTISMIEKENTNRKLPWLEKIIEKYNSSLPYTRGEAFCKSMDPIIIDPSNHSSHRIIKYPKDSIICEENTKNEEIYILHTGSIDVEMGKNKITTVDKPGTVLGEMSLLLNEKSSTTLKAKKNTVITKIKKNELKDFSIEQGDFLKNIVLSLTQKHYYNIIKINAVNPSIIEKKFNIEGGDNRKTNQIEKLKNNLSSLKREIEETAYQQNADFLTQIIKNIY